jgi:pyridoxine 5-phosphate synthase
MRLCINIDHIATLRNARGESQPDPVDAARVAERAGADGIVCHLREDRRHIRDADVRRLRGALTTKLDLEMAATPGIIAIALRILPELTTEGGLDVIRSKAPLARTVARFHEKGIPVSLFVDPVASQIEASKEIGADMIELHTGEYANARTAASRRSQLARIAAAAKLGRRLGLAVNAGHGLNYENIAPVRRIREIEEVSIGHAVIVRAVEVGLERAVKEMVGLLR